MQTHRAIVDLSIAKSIGHLEAEDMLRAMAQRDPDKARIVADIDRGREADRLKRLDRFGERAAAMGLSLDQARGLIETLYRDPSLLTWLSQRVHICIAHDRLIADDE